MPILTSVLCLSLSLCLISAVHLQIKEHPASFPFHTIQKQNIYNEKELFGQCFTPDSTGLRQLEELHAFKTKDRHTLLLAN